MLGHLWVMLGEYEAALACFTYAAVHDREDASHWYNRACIRRVTGDLAGAEADFSRAIARAPDDAQAYLSRSELRAQTSRRNHIEELEQALRRASTSWQRTVPLHFALAKEYEDLFDDVRAWRHLSEGAAVRRRHLQYDIRADLATVDWLREAFPVRMTPLPDGPSSEPIFVCGLFRTGLALVDGILCGHSAVQSAGELTHFGSIVVEAAKGLLANPKAIRPELVAASARLDFVTVGNEYLRRARPMRHRTAHFTDTLPFNYLYCGLIARAFRNAKIVHVSADPVATCFSLFKVLFEKGYPFSYDLTELARYYIGYSHLMEHWRETLPGRIVEVSHEDLVSRSAQSHLQLLEQLGLPRELDPCPVPARAAATWKRYEAQLQPLITLLGQAGLRDR